jgi:uncharacterized membrane protein
MNGDERSELEWLKQRQARLEQELALLAKQLKLIESRMDSRKTSVPTPEPVAPPPAPPVAEVRPPTPQPVRPPPLPPLIHQAVPVAAPKAAEPSTAPPPTAAQPGVSQPLPPIEPALPRAEAPPAKDRSLEMRVGTYWLVRIGIVVLLTGLVFFANYAYQNFIIKLGPAGKVSLMYVVSAALLGGGTWWQRKATKESLGNYAQVLFAGGLAAVYFTTYAAHHIDTLRVIASPFVDGVLLFVWTGFMVCIADRKKSEVLALFAVGLAYYTCVITRVESFTLYSNLLLTIAAVFFLVRNRWAALSYATLIGSYGAYAYWRFYNGVEWRWVPPEAGLWHGTYFLMGYWLIFTAAVFLSKHEKLAGESRAVFLTLNNSAFFVMFLFTMYLVREGKFWAFSVSYGSALLVCAAVARYVLASEPLTKNSYLTQGLLLVTIGIIAKFAGLKLALLLGAESVVLLTLGLARKNYIMQTGAFICGALAVGWAIDSLRRFDRPGLYIGTTVGALMIFNAMWSRLKAPENKNPIRVVPTFFTILALIVWLFTTWYNTSAANFPLMLAAETMAFTLSIYVLRVPELASFGQLYLLIAHGAWLLQWYDTDGPYGAPRAHLVPWWNAALMIGITLGLAHWWQRQKVLTIEPAIRWFWQAVCCLAIIVVVYVWQHPLWEAPGWLAFTSLLAVAITAYGVFTRAWAVAASGQIFVLVSVVEFMLQLAGRKPAWSFPLAPLAALMFLSLATVYWFHRRPDSREDVRKPLLQLALIYRWVAVLMSLWWINEYIPARERIWVSALCSVLAFLWAGWRKHSEALLVSTVFCLFALALFWHPWGESLTPTVYWPNLLAILALFAQQRIVKHWLDRYPLDARVQGGMILLAGLALWLFVTRWVLDVPGKSYLTASWSTLALILFVCGMVLRERVYRWLGLGILGATLIRVGIVDIPKLTGLYRILSIIALGLVLLVLGFIYNKYQEKIREWL